MFEDTERRINFWEDRVERLKKEIEEGEENNLSDDEMLDLHIALHEAEDNLNYAWQDDELEEMGLR